MARRQEIILQKGWLEGAPAPISNRPSSVEPLLSPFKSTELYSPEEIATISKVERDTVYTWISQGEFRASKLGRVWRVMGSELVSFFNKNTNNQSRKYAED